MIHALRRSRLLKGVALLLAFDTLLQCLAPQAAYALTSGPASPEFSSFEPVATTDMVNLFSGDFNYNLPVLEIPGPDGGGYALSLSYHSGTNSEEEASWVGYGWTLNPGAVNRNTRGFPDDYKDVAVNQYNKSRPSWSASVSNTLGADIFSKKLSKKNSENSTQDSSNASFSASFSLRNTLRYNNYQGFAKYLGFGVGVKGLGSLDMNIGADGATFSAEVNVASMLFKKKEGGKQAEKKPLFDWRGSLQKGMPSLESAVNANLGSTYGLFSFSETVRPTSSSRYESVSYNSNLGVSVQANIPVGVHAGRSGNFTLHRSQAGERLTAQGFMHTPADMQDGVLSDYYVEKGNPHSKRDLNLGIPFNNADNFMVTGEGLAGGFRYYPAQTGHFYPNTAENVTKIRQTGFDLGIGASIGIGLHFGMGSEKALVKDWGEKGNTDDFRFNGQPEGVFRFNNDMGGTVSYGPTNLSSAYLNTLSPVPGAKVVEPYLSPALSPRLDTARAKASSYIAYRTYDDVQNNAALRFNKGTNRSTTNPGNPAAVAELSVHNSDGIQYVYGLPVYTRNETNVQVDVKPADVPADNYLAYQPLALRNNGGQYALDVAGNTHTAATGEIRNTPYTSAYLLTQIFTPDYVDVNNNGADAPDFGGWTQFSYQKAYGASGDWYRWRMPYNGLLYNKNGISDKRDDLGAVSTGEKELYYLKTIETKTHVAFFVTNDVTAGKWDDVLNGLGLKGKLDENLLKGSGKARLDGLGARPLPAGSLNDPAARFTAKGGNEQKLQHLEKIVLFAKARPEQPLKTTYFAYDYSLVGNLPNHVNGKYPANKDEAAQASGKLTLKKVWFEYEGVVSARISPYEFAYAYKPQSTYPDHIRALYPEATGVSSRYSDYAQNPDYSPHLQDPWGNLQVYGKERKGHTLPWIYQGPLPATGEVGKAGWRADVAAVSAGDAAYKEFDPAAWQLKQITLPSGGQILVEYEQKDYAYVQDRAPMAMASLLQANEPMDKDRYGTAPSYTINTRDLGLDPNSPGYAGDLAAQIEKIRTYFAGEKIYFKYLYALTDHFGAASLDNCLSEYITGYAVVDRVEAATVQAGDASEQHIKLTLKGENSKNGNRTAVPRQACYEYYTTQRMGKWQGADCESLLDGYEKAAITPNVQALLDGNLRKRIEVVPPVLDAIGELLYNEDYKIPAKETVGTDLNLPLSFLKLPMIKAKKGGGIRVKRLLMYDPGIEAGDAALYGQEYRYESLEAVDGQVRTVSSGVATNEPADAREENPLVGFMPRKGQSFYSRITAGEDKEQTEGPLGETLLPAASIGHSRVVVQNIHQGATGTGHTVHEFHTVQDYPFDRTYLGDAHSDFGKTAKGVDFTPLSDNQKRDFMKIPAGFFYYEVNKMWAAQGYRFIVNNMHGQSKRTASYPGSYDPALYSVVNDRVACALKPLSSQETDYYAPGEGVRMLYPDGRYRWEVPGKEMDVTLERKAVLQKTMDLSLDLDITIGFTLPVVISASPSFAYYNKGISTHVTSKVIRYPVLVKAIRATQDGVSSITQHLAFNAHTGQVALTRTEDGFNGVVANGKKLDGNIFSLSLPASWYYPQMGRKTDNPANTNQLSAPAGNVVSYGLAGLPLRFDSTRWRIPTEGVINASAQTYGNDWFSGSDETDAVIAAGYAGLAGARQALNAKWRPKANYLYRTDVVSANGPNGRIYGGGVMQGFVPFKDWHRGTGAVPDQSRWIMGSHVTKYSPHGNPLEEQNVLGIYSAAAFGYNGQLPVMVAQNARYAAIRFTDYESETAAGVTAVAAHSGRQSRQLVTASNVVLSGVTVAPGAYPKGALFQVWARADAAPNLRVQLGAATVALAQVAQTGPWALYRGEIPAGDLPGSGAFDLTLLSSATANSPVYVDDVRLQPLEAQATCYVYDTKTLRLLTQFDDQHFGLYYQYNDEGKLVRKLIETERGLKTVQETQYNTVRKGKLGS